MRIICSFPSDCYEPGTADQRHRLNAFNTIYAGTGQDLTPIANFAMRPVDASVAVTWTAGVSGHALQQGQGAEHEKSDQSGYGEGSHRHAELGLFGRICWGRFEALVSSPNSSSRLPSASVTRSPYGGKGERGWRRHTLAPLGPGMQADSRPEGGHECCCRPMTKIRVKRLTRPRLTRPRLTRTLMEAMKPAGLFPEQSVVEY